MTIFYPDISNYNKGLIIQPGTVAVCAKSTEGHTFIDPYYKGFKSQAAGVGADFFAYHWLHENDPDGQAAFCTSIIGTGMSVMIDAENTTVGDTDHVDTCIQFAQGLRNRGNFCNLVYLPKWYWSNNLGKPDLGPLAANGLHIVSSNYTTYSDTGVGWQPYYPGAPKPVIWQYADNFQYGGQACDFNAFQGTREQLRVLLGYATAPDPIPVKENEVKRLVLKDSTGQLWISDLMHMRKTTDRDAANAVYADPTGFVTQKDMDWEGSDVWSSLTANPSLGNVVRAMPDADKGAYGVPVDSTSAAGVVNVAGTVSGTLNVTA